MPAERLSMRKVREVLRLKHALGLSYREISEATGVGKTVVKEYIRRAEVIGITWPVPEAIDDAELERRLFPVGSDAALMQRGPIDWPRLHGELKRRGVPAGHRPDDGHRLKPRRWQRASLARSRCRFTKAARGSRPRRHCSQSARQSWTESARCHSGRPL
jgi:Sigma-70, region 4